MALIPCRECSASISDQALSCPSCGAPTAAGRRREENVAEVEWAAQEDAREKAAKERQKRRSNTQGCGCLLIIAAGLLAATGIAGGLGMLLGVIGLVVLIVGLLPS